MVLPKDCVAIVVYRADGHFVYVVMVQMNWIFKEVSGKEFFIYFLF